MRRRYFINEYFHVKKQGYPKGASGNTTLCQYVGRFEKCMVRWLLVRYGGVFAVSGVGIDQIPELNTLIRWSI